MPHDKTLPSTDMAKLKARLDFVEQQYRSLQLNMKYQREAFLKNTGDPFLLKLAPPRYRSLEKLKQIASLPFGWRSILWRHPLKFSLWWTARKLQTPDAVSNKETEEIFHDIGTIVADKKFNHVFFMPFVSRGGGEKYILNIMDELYRQNSTEPILMIVDSNYSGLTWEERLPIGVDYIDLSILCQHMPLDKRYEQAFHLAQTVSGENAQWHFQPTDLLSHLSQKYRQELKKRHIIFYHFCNNMKYQGNQAYVSDKICRKIAEHSDLITKIISDNQSILIEDKHFLERKGIDAAQEFTCLYTSMETLNPLADMPPDTPLHPPRIFWASRLDRQKRLSLIFTLGEKMREKLLGHVMNLYGYSAFGHDFHPEELPSSVKFHGAFNGLASLDIKPCDILLYTSHIDGLPNVILEAISLGVVVIAPDVGGIGEMIKNNETGILLPNIADDEAMAELYIHALKKLLEDDNSRLQLAQNAQKLLQKNHAPAIFAENIRKIFGSP